MFEGFAGVKAFESNIQGIGTLGKLQIVPGDQFGIRPYPCPGGLLAGQFLEKGHHVLVVRFGVHLVAILDEEHHVFIGAKACIQAKIGFHGVTISGIVLLEPFQALIQPL